MTDDALDDGSVPFELPAQNTNTLLLGEESREIVESLLQRLQCLLPVISTETISTLRESITSQSEGSVVVPGQLQWPVGELSLALLRVSIHWSWQGATTTCLLNVLSKRAHLAHSNVSPEDANKSHAHAPSAQFENIQISLEQTANLPTRLFCKLDTVKFLALEFSSLTLSGTLLEPPNIPISRLDQTKLAVAQVTLTSASKPTSTHHIFLASLLSILYTLMIPHASLLSTTRLVLKCATDNSHSAIPPSRMMAPFRSTPTTTLGDVFRHFYNTAEDSVDTMTKSMPTLNHAASSDSNSKSTDSSHSNLNSNLNSNADTNTTVSKWDKIRGSVSDSLAMTAGCVAAGASFVTPIGAVASVAALGVKDAAHAAAQKGQRARGAGDGYKFGDMARGMVASVAEKKQQQQPNHSRAYSEFDELNLQESGNTDLDDAINRNRQSSSEMSHRPSLASAPEHGIDDYQPPQQRLSRYACVVGSSVGAGFGRALVGGPIGFVAGSLVGSQATQSALQKKRPEETPPPPPCTTSRTFSGPAHADNSSMMHPDDLDLVNQLEHHDGDDSSKPDFRVGDNLRGMVAWGKQKTHPDNSSLMHCDDQDDSVNRLEHHDGDDSSKPEFRLGDNLRGIVAWGKQTAHADNSSLMHSDDQDDLVNQLEQLEQEVQNDDSSKPGFRLGDNLRGIAARGKQVTGRNESSSFQFGDFSRGLFSGKKT
jgi:hypothetical protein